MESLGILLQVIAVIYNSFCWGYVAYKFYGWFVISSIPNLPQFSITEFVGFILFLSVIMPKSSSHIKKEYKDGDSEILSMLLAPWIVLFLGWVIHSIFFILLINKTNYHETV